MNGVVKCACLSECNKANQGFDCEFSQLLNKHHVPYRVFCRQSYSPFELRCIYHGNALKEKS